MGDGSRFVSVDHLHFPDALINTDGQPVLPDGDFAASSVSLVPSGGISATDVQAGIEDLDTDKQAVNAALTDISGLSPTNNDFLQRKSGAWANRTPTQALADLAAVGTTFQPKDTDLTDIAGLSPTNDDVIQRKSGAWANRTMAQLAADLPLAQRVRAINVMIGDGTNVIGVGTKAAVEIPFAWTDIESWRVISVDNTSGSVVVDVKKATYANSPGTLTSIAASAKPTLSTATKNENTTLTGWTKTGSKGDFLYFITEATPSSVKLIVVSLVLVI